MLYSPEEAHSGPNLVSKMDGFAKSSIVDVLRGPESIKCLTINE